MVDEVAQDDAKVELGTQVRGDTAQGLGLLQLAPEAADQLQVLGHHGDLVGHRLEQLAVLRAEGPDAVVAHEQHAPRLTLDEDGHRDLGAHLGQVDHVPRVPIDLRGEDRAALGEAGARQAVLTADGRDARDVQSVGRPQPEQVAGQLGERHDAIAERLAQEAGDGRQRDVEVGGGGDRAGDAGQHPQLDVAPVGVTCGRGQDALGDGAGRDLGACSRPGREGRVGPRSEVRDRQAGGSSAARRLLQERLEIRRAVAPVAAAVDAQAGQAALLGPRAHGVGVDAEDAGRAGDRNGAGG